ncbi:transcription/translation regulatory transformer protein RfaH [Halomonadaceae bacterium KBTZ08]
MAWYAVQHKPAQAERALANLEYQGVECFFPEIDVETIQRGKRRIRREPLFRGYLFINLELTDPVWHKLRSTRGVVRVVSFGNRPAPIEDDVIQSIREGLDSAAEAGGIRRGDKLDILEGPFRGLNAVFQEYDGEARAMVLIDFLQKQHRVSMELNQVAPG